jgi:tRNA(adenine34) deaminase
MTPDEIKKGLAEALSLAQKAAEEDEVPVGAVVVQNGKIIGRGYNRREQDHNPLAHAEVLAIVEATQHLKSWRLNDCSLIVTLEPCPMCLAACQQARVAEVYYGARDPKGGALSLGYSLHEDLKTNHRFQVQLFDEPACGAVLSEFFGKKRKQK